jgi:hypothetical protein
MLYQLDAVIVVYVFVVVVVVVVVAAAAAVVDSAGLQVVDVVVGEIEWIADLTALKDHLH